jgi:hypothetical protein
MTDNVTIDTAGALDRDAELALDQVTRGGVLEDEQVIKIALGADGDFDCLLDSGQQTMAQSVPVAIASNQSAVPVSGPVTYVSGTALTPKWAAIHCNTNGDNAIVAAVVDHKIRVLSVYLVAAGAATARFESGASGTALSGQMSLVNGHNEAFIDYAGGTVLRRLRIRDIRHHTYGEQDDRTLLIEIVEH